MDPHFRVDILDFDVSLRKNANNGEALLEKTHIIITMAIQSYLTIHRTVQKIS